MEGLKDFGNRLSKAMDTGAEAVSMPLHALGDGLADLLETPGNGMQDGLNALGNLLYRKPERGKFFKAAVAWLGGIIAGLTNLSGAVLRGAFGIAAGALGGLVRIIGGLFGLDWPLIRKGLLDIASGIAGALIVVLGSLISLLQRIIFCQNNERRLSQEEREMLGQVFHPAVSLYNIRLIEGWSGLFGTGTQGAFTLGNTVYSNRTDFRTNPQILVHECVHVWQYQHLGPRYTADALGAQWLYGRDGSLHDAYSWLDELERGHGHWQDFNREASAALIDDIWSSGILRYRKPGTSGWREERGRGAFFKKPAQAENSQVEWVQEFYSPYDRRNHTPLALAAVKKVRAAWNFRVSQFI